MFRSKRSNLLKRLLKSQLLRHETRGSDEGSADTTGKQQQEQRRALLHALLKKLKERQLEVLAEAVEGGVGERSGCVLLPSSGEVQLGRGRSTSPHVLFCITWRWPSLHHAQDLRLMPSCRNNDPLYTCCNPYHWSRQMNIDSPPPPYTALESKHVIHPDAKMPSPAPSPPVSMETGGTPSIYGNITGGTNGSGGTYWCQLAYWELRQRVGRLFSVGQSGVNVFQDLPHGDGMCLSLLQQQTANDGVKRTREKIGFGVLLSREGQEVWLYNQSANPVFVNSPTLDVPNSLTTVVTKVPHGYSLKVFDFEQSAHLEKTRDPQLTDGPYDPHSIRISFAKGWGPSYKRQFVTSCPCWLEVLLRQGVR